MIAEDSRFEVWVNGEPSPETLPSIRAAWQDSVPDMVMRVESFVVGASVKVFGSPEVIMGRIA